VGVLSRRASHVPCSAHRDARTLSPSREMCRITSRRSFAETALANPGATGRLRTVPSEDAHRRLFARANGPSRNADNCKCHLQLSSAAERLARPRAKSESESESESERRRTDPVTAAACATWCSVVASRLRTGLRADRFLRDDTEVSARELRRGSPQFPTDFRLITAEGETATAIGDMLTGSRRP